MFPNIFSDVHCSILVNVTVLPQYSLHRFLQCNHVAHCVFQENLAGVCSIREFNELLVNLLICFKFGLCQVIL